MKDIVMLKRQLSNEFDMKDLGSSEEDSRNANHKK